jgi:hypothetical protein
MQERGDRGAGCESGGGPWQCRQRMARRVGRLNAACGGGGGEGRLTAKMVMSEYVRIVTKMCGR